MNKNRQNPLTEMTHSMTRKAEVKLVGTEAEETEEAEGEGFLSFSLSFFLSCHTTSTPIHKQRMKGTQQN